MATEMANLVIQEFKPKEATREEWDLFHAYRKVRHQEVRPEDPVIPDDLVETQMKRDDPFSTSRYFGIVDEGRVISSFSASVLKPESPGYENNKHLMFAGASVIQDLRRQGIGRLWLSKVLEMMEEYGPTVLTASTEQEEGHAFLKWLGAEGKQEAAENRLDFEALDWPMVEQWVKEGPDRAQGTNIIFYENRMPDEILDEYCEVYTRIANTVPRDDIDMGDWVVSPAMFKEGYERLDAMDGVHHSFITREADEKISGMTEVYYIPAREKYISQNLTGVLPEYRGKGLGKWLKAQMLLYVKDKYPNTKWVVTGNADSNAAMLAINTKLGFREYKASSTYQIKKEALSAFVAKHSS